ncbi:related to MFS maltose permease [Cephalotrichum gorgonifer]|uniref:Related to MFS maltose permease n=1 Tax=Cephalotrichum gorgonifer TaxID=2041049 RepID=A0AAE8N2D9_9PEZI|nr:related to MFS maltose permease [Cephalotrichum gorgonifer]
MAPDIEARKADTEAHEMATNVKKEPEYLDFVQEATDSEHQMSLLQALQLYPKAAGWSVALSACLIMEGYDKSLLGSLYAFPAFKRQFGMEMPDGTYQVTAPWQAGLSNGAQVGSIIGLLGSGTLAERFGYRIVIMGSLVAMIAFIFLMFFAVNIEMLQAAYILVGIPWGVFQTITTTYAAEVCPTILRPYLTTFVNLCWVIGQLTAAGVLRAFVGDAGQWAWRIPYAIQWAYPVPILIAVYLAPESPWWLVRKGRLDDAEKSLQRLTSRKMQEVARFDPRKTVAMMVHTNEIEKAQVAGTSYMDCFRGVNLRRTEITCAVWAAQALCGNVFMIYSSYFYQLAGLPTEHAFSMTVGQYGMAFVGTLLSWVCIVYFGRRTLYATGLFTLFAILLIIGIISVTPASAGSSWGTASLVLVYTFTYDLFIGPICYSLVAEMPSTRLRPKTVVLARATFNICGIIDAVLMPYMLNPTAWNWGGKAGFFWAGSCLMCAVYMYLRLPEPRGKTYGELDVLFEQKVGARKFGKAKVNPVSGSVEISE